MPTISELFLPHPRYFGLSIGRSTLRAVEVNHKGQITAISESPIPEDTFDRGILVKRDLFLTSIKSLLSTAKFRTNFTAVCFPEIYSYSREYTVPLLSKTEITEAISWHVKDLFPFPADEIYYDWKIIERHPTDYHIVVVSTPRKVIDPLLSVLEEANLRPLSFEPGSSVISRLLLQNSQESSVLIEINPKTTYITLVEKGKDLFTTVVSFTPNDTPQSYLQNITQTLKEIVNYYLSKTILQTNQPPTFLTGDLATIQWADALAQNLGYPVKLLSTPVPHPGYNKAYAAAVAKISPPQDEDSVNLIPASLQNKYNHERKVSFYSSLLIRSSLLLGIATLAAGINFALVKQERQRLDNEIARLTQSTNSQKSENLNLLSLNANATTIVTLAPLKKTPSDHLTSLKNLLPPEISITEWFYDDSKLSFTLKGVAPNRSDLINLKNRLENSTTFTKPNLPIGSLESSRNTKFSITFNTKK